MKKTTVRLHAIAKLRRAALLTPCLALCLASAGHAVFAQTTTAPAKPATAAALNAHTLEDIQRHRAMARAHEAAASCLHSGKTHAQCQAQLQLDCKGLALGKHCGMRHAH